MAATLECPACGRRVAAPAGTDAVICDGCELMFDPASIHFQPAPLWKRSLGNGLVGLGMLCLIATLVEALPKFDIHNTDAVIRLGGSLNWTPHSPGAFADTRCRIDQDRADSKA